MAGQFCATYVAVEYMTSNKYIMCQHVNAPLIVNSLSRFFSFRRIFYAHCKIYYENTTRIIRPLHRIVTYIKINSILTLVMIKDT